MASRTQELQDDINAAVSLVKVLIALKQKGFTAGNFIGIIADPTLISAAKEFFEHGSAGVNELKTITAADIPDLAPCIGQAIGQLLVAVLPAPAATPTTPAAPGA